MANNQQTFNPNATFNWDTEAGAPQIDTKNLGIIQDQMHHEALAYKNAACLPNGLPSSRLRT